LSKVAGRKRWVTRSEDETEAVGIGLVRDFGPLATFLIAGPLGAGKTVVVRGMAFALGVPRREVQSPTYTLIHEHEGSHGRLVHVDLYRLRPADVATLGLDELLAAPGIKAVEWPDRLPFALPGAYTLDLRPRGDGRREIVLTPP
jgi:tRNA threonylcarbamoyladenosine biosynthesis protein TsaE